MQTKQKSATCPLRLKLIVSVQRSMRGTWLSCRKILSACTKTRGNLKNIKRKLLNPCRIKFNLSKTLLPFCWSATNRISNSMKSISKKWMISKNRMKCLRRDFNNKKPNEKKWTKCTTSQSRSRYSTQWSKVTQLLAKWLAISSGSGPARAYRVVAPITSYKGAIRI